MMTGEYFLSEQDKEHREHEKKRVEKEAKKQEKIDKKLKVLEAPEDEITIAPMSKSEQQTHKKPDINELKSKFLKKK